MTILEGTSVALVPNGLVRVLNDWLTVRIDDVTTVTDLVAPAECERLLEIDACRASNGVIWACAKSGATFGGVNRVVLAVGGLVLRTDLACVAQEGCKIRAAAETVVLVTQTHAADPNTGQRAAYTGRVYGLTGEVLRELTVTLPPPLDVEGSTLGILDLDPISLTPIWAELAGRRTEAGIDWRFALERGPHLIGQYGDRDFIGGITAGEKWTAITQHALRPRAVVDPDGRLRVAAALAHGRVAVAEAPFEPWQPDIAPFNRPMVWAPYWATAPDPPATYSQYGRHDVAGNAEMLQGGARYADMRRPRPVIVAPEALDSVPDDQILAISVAADVAGADLVEQLAAARALPRVQTLGVGCAIYTDAATVDDRIRPRLHANDWVIVKAYRDQVETPAMFEARVHAEIVRVSTWGVPLLLALGFSDRGFLSAADLEALMPVYRRLMDHPAVEGGLVWAIGRPTGLVDHPTLTPWYDAFARACGDVLPAFPRLRPGAGADPGSLGGPVGPGTPDVTSPDVGSPRPELPPATRFKESPVKIAIKNAKGLYLCIPPNQPDRIETREAAGAWETAELVKDGDDFLVRYVEADRRLSLTPDGAIEVRPASAAGPWERFKATTQPDGSQFLYRAGESALTVLRFEVRG